MHVPTAHRDGFALPAALLAMIVIGAIVTGGFYLSSQEHRVSLSTDHGARALYVAQYGLEEALATWSNATIANATGPVQSSVWNGGQQLGTYTIGVMHLGDRVYALESEGHVVRGQQTATRRVGSFVRIATASMPYASALTVLGQLDAGGNATISGYDQCTASSVPGVMAVDDSLIDGVMKNPSTYRIYGSPPVDEDPDMTQEKLSDFGEIDLSGLIESATHRYSGNPAWPQHMAPQTTQTGSGETVCNTSIQNNWGDPSGTPGPCGTYYPIIHVQGNLKLDVGRGQGILIVEGNLEIDGNVEFSGIVIVTGQFLMQGTGSKINGTVIVQGDGELDTESTQSGNAMVQYNSCKIRDALNNNLRVRPLASRSWFTDTAPLPVLGT